MKTFVKLISGVLFSSFLLSSCIVTKKKYDAVVIRPDETGGEI